MVGKEMLADSAILETEEAARAARNKYLREWRARNRERVREHTLSYWLRKAAKEAANDDHRTADNK